MKKTKPLDSSSSSKPIRPALSPEARENQMISLAVDLAEKQLMEGTASSQVITHYLKLGTRKEELEREKLSYENELIKAKKDAIQSQQRSEELFAKAIAAFGVYSGQTPAGGEDDEYDY